MDNRCEIISVTMETNMETKANRNKTQEENREHTSKQQ